MSFKPLFSFKNSKFSQFQPYIPLFYVCVSGLLMAAAAAPLNYWWLAWVALAPLWVYVVQTGKAYTPENTKASSGAKPTQCALVWGIAYHGLTLSWITGLHPLTWLGVPWLASVGISLFCWGFITLWGTATVMLWAWLMRRLTKCPVWGRLLIGVASWCGLETLLNLTPLSWTSLSFTQSPGNLVILHLGQLSGPMLLTAVIVAVNGLLAESWLGYREARSRSGPVRRWVYSLIAIAVLLTSGAHALGYWLYTQPLTATNQAPLTVGIVQGNIPTRQKLSGEGVRRAIQGYVSGYEWLVEQQVDAVLTPEGALPFLWNPNQNPLRQAVLERGVAAWLGTFVADNGRITQSLLAIAGNGEVVGRYNKVKLVPLGEYIPFQDTLGRVINRLSPIEANMQPGRMDQQFDTPFGLAIASICYESAFPQLFRNQAVTGGQFILTASNLDPYSEVLMAQHQAQDLMRAIESDRWAVRATNTGYSSVIDPHGHILWRSQPKTYQLHHATIYRRQTQTLYVRWGDWLTPILLGMAGGTAILAKLKTDR